jgi:putative transposase
MEALIDLCYRFSMKLTLQLQLLPDEAQSDALRETMERFNEAATWLAGHAYARKLANKIELQKLHYRELRERFALSSQMAVRCIAQVVEAYKRDKSKQPTFRPHAAAQRQQRDAVEALEGHDPLVVGDGRVVVPFVMGAYQRERFGFAKGQCDLVLRPDGLWWLLATVDVPDGTPLPSSDFLGVDLGVVNLATDSDGCTHSGATVEAVRVRLHERRRKLQKAAAARKKRGRRPKNIRRALRRLNRREARFRAHVNHILSKQLVAKAKDTGCGLALEDLQGIRDRTRFRKPQRARMAGWAFSQLRTFVAYKARLAGVRLVLVDPTNTSRTCATCGHCDKANRRSQAQFGCQACGHQAHADLNAARNIRARAAVNQPMVSEQSRQQAPSTGISSVL